ncbi:hypothetical protein EDD85DRAFT_798912 [Armillaria nabsnona]|nr:hypothetical protein EDD85DRAFT_798912 [Armillaria nabsnona]
MKIGSDKKEKGTLQLFAHSLTVASVLGLGARCQTVFVRTGFTGTWSLDRTAARLALQWMHNNPRGLETLQDIVKKLVPAWKHGMTDIQELAVSRILDGEDVLLCTATGGRKSASFAIPILVSGLKEFGINGLTYNQETLTEARKARRVIAEEISSCLIWQWGNGFRPCFKQIGAFFRGRPPSTLSVIGLSATLPPGPCTLSVCKSLGFTGDRFHILRRSNKRPNTQFIIEVLESAISGNEFPQLLSYISSGRKTIIHCKNINQVFRVYLYLWRMELSGINHLRLYTLRLLNEDPYCQIVIATIAFANGINVKTLLDSITIRWSDTLAITWQEKGRVGRDDKSDSRGICLVPKSTFKTAENHLNGNPSKSSKQQTDDAAARVLTEKHCLIAAVNRKFKNPPPEISTLDCIEAKRRLPCFLCCKRAGIILRFHAPDNPPDTEMPEPFPQAEVPSSTPKKRSKAAPDQLKKKEKEASRERLLAFDAAVWTAERNSPSERNRPLKYNKKYKINVKRTVAHVMQSNEQRAKRRGEMDSPIPSDNEDTRSPSPISPNPETTAPSPLNAPPSPPPLTLPQKRKALEDVTNKVPRKRAPQLSVAAAMAEYGPRRSQAFDFVSSSPDSSSSMVFGTSSVKPDLLDSCSSLASSTTPSSWQLEMLAPDRSELREEEDGEGEG